MTTSEQSLLRQYSDIPFPHVPGRILLVFVNRSVAQAESDRRYVVQAAVALTNGAKSKAVRPRCSSVGPLGFLTMDLCFAWRRRIT